MPAQWVATREIELASLTRFPGNARRGNTAEIRKSIKRHGQYRAIVVRAHDGQHTILAGNHTADALQAEGHATARCEVIECTDDEAIRINLGDNKIAEDGSYDDEALAELLAHLDGDYDGTGWSEEDVAALLEPADELPPAGNGDPDATPELQAGPPVTQPGDIWLLGPHRLICGDCRDFGTVEKLLAGERVNVAFTSPPYASQRAYDESSGFKPIPPGEYVDWFEDVQANVRAHLAEDGSWFVNIKEHAHDGQRDLYVKDLTIAHVRRWGWMFVDEFVWNKPDPFPGYWAGRFKNGWEPVFQFAAEGGFKHRPDAVAVASDTAIISGTTEYRHDLDHGEQFKATKGAGLALPSNVLTIHAGANSEGGHAAAYPVDLPAWFIRAYSDPGDTVFDPFMGSGSTLIAAHLEGRTAYGCEISPGYCDVICRRWQEQAGEKPQRVLGDGSAEPTDFAGPGR